MALAKVFKLELTNFKSYKGTVTVGPFLDFTCIVGPNGSGKSNVMDALSFVLGQTAQKMRGSQLDDLINKSATKKECSVSLFLKLRDGKERVFTRGISSSGAMVLSIDKDAVNDSEFRSALQRLKIGKRLETFLVFQHAVDTIAQMKPKEYTELIEDISTSSELKSEYNAKKRALVEANHRLAVASSDKRSVMAEVSQLKLQKKEAEKYKEYAERLMEERRVLALTELFHLETRLHDQKQKVATYQKEVSRLQQVVKGTGDIAQLKEDFGKKQRKYHECLNNNRQLAAANRDKQTTLDRIKASIEHFKKKLLRDEADYKAATKSNDVRSKEMDRLKGQLKQNEQLLLTLEEKWKKEDSANSSGSSKSLSAAERAEYVKLRSQADCQTITKRQELDLRQRHRETLMQTQKQTQAQMDGHRAQEQDLKAQLERYEQALEAGVRRQKDLEEECNAKKLELTESKETLAQTQSKAHKRDTEIQHIDAQLRDLRGVRDVSKHDRKMKDALMALQSMHAGIRGRLYDLCTIPDDKYKVAVTVAMGKHLDALVVDTTETAVACIRYLKDQRIGTMSFIPLNSAQGKRVDDSLRTFGGSCKPVIDVIKYDASIEAAVRFAVGQTLVCDTINEARQVAYERPDGSRHKVVTKDGSTLMKNGAIQGGLAAVSNRAKMWDEKQYESLMQARENLLNEGGSEAADQRLQSRVQELTGAISGLELRITRARDDQKAIQQRMARLEQDIQKTMQQTTVSEARLDEIKKQVKAYEAEMLTIQNSITSIENKVFAEFQKRVGIENVADLEEKNAETVKHRSEKRAQLQLTMNKLTQAIATYILGDAPFTAKANPDYPGYTDYDQLMRVEEWQVLLSERGGQAEA